MSRDDEGYREGSLSIEPDNRGIRLSFGGGTSRERLMPSPDASQTDPRAYYAYAHVDSSGRIFYVGKGKGRRAWDKDRHSVWQFYVNRHLDGDYRVLILADGLEERAAEDLEAEWIAQEGAGLVNWFNMARGIDLEANARFHRLRNKNRDVARRARALEKSDLVAAVELYEEAVKRIDEYASIDYEEGLVGDLLREMREEEGIAGDIGILDRLSICLVRSGRALDAQRIADEYFSKYRRDARLKVADRIRTRVRKAVARVQHSQET